MANKGDIRTATCPTCDRVFQHVVVQGRRKTHCSAECRARHQLTNRLHRNERSTEKCANGLCLGRVVFRKSAHLCEACYCYNRRTGQVRPINKPKGHYTASGYRMVHAVGHPLAMSGIREGWIYEHRKVAYDSHGGVCPPCHWCGCQLSWSGIVVDHLNERKSDNRPENIVICCNRCNRARGAMLPFLGRVKPERVAQLLDCLREHAERRCHNHHSEKTSRGE